MINISRFFNYYDNNKGVLRKIRGQRHPVVQNLRERLNYDENYNECLVEPHLLLEIINSVLSNNTITFSVSSLTNSFLQKVIFQAIQDHPHIDSFSNDADPSEINQQLDDIIQDLQTNDPNIFKTITRNRTKETLTRLIDQISRNTLEVDEPKQHLIPKLEKLLRSITTDNINIDFTAHNYIDRSLQTAEKENFKVDPVLNFLQDENADTIIEELSNKQLLTPHHLKLLTGQQEAVELFQRPNRATQTYYQNASKIIQILDPETRAYLQPSPLLYLNQLLFENRIDINNVYQSIQNDQQRELVSAFLTYMLQMIIKALSYDYRDNLLANKHIDPSVKKLILDISNITDQTYSKYYKLFTNATASGILTEHPEFFRYTIDYADEYDIDYEQLMRLLDAQTENGSYIEQHDLKHPLLLVKDTWRLHQIQQYYDSCQSDSLEDLTRSNLDTLQKSRNVQYVIFRTLSSDDQVKELLQNTPSDFFGHSGRLLVCFQIARKQYDNNTADFTLYNLDALQRIIEAFIRLESCFNNLDEVHRLKQTQQNNLQNFPRLNDSQQTKLIATLTFYQVTPAELKELTKLKTSCFECTLALDSILHLWKKHDIELTRLITRVNNLTTEANNLLVNNLKIHSNYHAQLVNSILEAHPISTPGSSTNTENADQYVADVNAQKLFSEADLINHGPCIDLVDDTTMQSSDAVATLDKSELDDQTILQKLSNKYAIDTNSSNTNNNPFINMTYLKWLMSKLNSSSDTAPTPRHPITRQLLHLKKISDSHINIDLLKTYLQDYHKSTYFQQPLATVLLIDDLLQAKASLVKAMHEANSANQINSGAMYPQLTEQGADINEAIQQLNSSSDIYDMQTHFINILNKMDQAHTLSHFANQLEPYHASLANTVASLCHSRKNASDSDTQPGITLNDMTQHYTLTADRILAANNQGCYENTHNDENTHNAAARPSF